MWPLLLLAAATPSTPLPKIAVMDVTVRGGVAAAIAQVLSDDIVAEVRKRRQRSQVISAEEIQSMLSIEGERQKLGCHGDNVACLAEIGGALGAEEMVNGTLGKLGKTYVFGLKIIDVGHAKVIRSASVNLSTRDDDELLSAAQKLVAELFPDVQLAPPPVAQTEPPAEPQPAPVPAAALQPQPTVAVSSEPRPSHSHVPAILLGVAGLAAVGVAVFGLTRVLAYDSDVSAINGNKGALNYGNYKSDQSSAQLWQPLSIGLGVLGIAGLTTAVFLW